MVIAARFKGRCRVCGSTIARGEQIEWTKADGAAHVTCAGVESTATPKPQTDDEIRADRRRRGLCPTCGGSMPRGYSAKGYQCDGCADAEEGIGWSA